MLAVLPSDIDVRWQRMTALCWLGCCHIDAVERADGTVTRLQRTDGYLERDDVFALPAPRRAGYGTDDRPVTTWEAMDAAVQRIADLYALPPSTTVSICHLHADEVDLVGLLHTVAHTELAALGRHLRPYLDAPLHVHAQRSPTGYGLHATGAGEDHPALQVVDPARLAYTTPLDVLLTADGLRTPGR